MADQELRVCVIGDELSAGTGDNKGLGWTGRVTARTRTEATMSTFVLGVPNETSTELSNRWEGEVNRRLGPEQHTDNRLVIALGRQDVRSGLSIARSRLNLANILDVAESRRIPAFVVGPPPGLAEMNDQLGDLSKAFADVAHRRRVPYVDTFSPLVTHEQWLADLATRGDDLPAQAGYGLMAWLVLHTGWHTWLGLEDPVR